MKFISWYSRKGKSMKENQNKLNILGKEYENSMNKKKRKTYGSFYTPDFIVDYIIENTLSNVDLVENPFVRILDPSCGAGYFLIKAYDFLINEFNDKISSIRDRYFSREYTIKLRGKLVTLCGEDYWKKENLHYHILKHCLYGADIDREAVQITKKNLLSKGLYNVELEKNIICCNSLIKWEEDYGVKGSLEVNKDFNMEELKKNLDKTNLDELEDICGFWKLEYDYIIGNPPWVSLSRKHKKNVDDSLINYYIEQYDGNKYLPNLYEYFIKRAVELVKDKGRVGFIIPDRFARNLQYKRLRQSLLKNYRILNLAFEISFPEINTDTMIFIVEKSYKNNNLINIDIFNKRQYSIYQDEYLNSENYEFIYESQYNYKVIKNKVDSESVCLGDICTTFTGFIGESKKISMDRTSDSQVKILKGENIGRFNIKSNCYYELVPENIKGGTKNIAKLSCPLKIIIRKTGSNIIAALDTEGYIIEQSLYGIINLNNNFSYKYILGILNSKLIDWYYSNFLITNINSTPQIKKYSLNKIPIKICSMERQSVIEQLVDEISIETRELIDKKYVFTKNLEFEENKRLDYLKSQLDCEIFSLYEIENEDVIKI